MTASNTVELEYFDVNCQIGVRQIMNPGSYYKTEELVRKMEYNGIKNAMVSHSMAEGYHPLTGNRMLMEEIKPHANLHPVWFVLPHHTGDFPNPGELRAMLKESGVKMVRMLPHSHGYSVSEWNCGPLFNMLEETGVLLSADSPQMGYDAIHGILTAHPKLRLVLTNIHYNCARNIYPLLEKFENLYAETIGFKVLDGIEDICGRFGAKKLLFGSMSPVYSASAAIGMVTYSNIADSEKQMIACGNFEKLLEGVRL